jgi:hypothetical protein
MLFTNKPNITPHRYSYILDSHFVLDYPDPYQCITDTRSVSCFYKIS